MENYKVLVFHKSVLLNTLSRQSLFFVWPFLCPQSAVVHFLWVSYTGLATMAFNIYADE
jgi:hypothetical protein